MLSFTEDLFKALDPLTILLQASPSTSGSTQLTAMKLSRQKWLKLSAMPHWIRDMSILFPGTITITESLSAGVGGTLTDKSGSTIATKLDLPTRRFTRLSSSVREWI